MPQLNKWQVSTLPLFFTALCLCCIVRKTNYSCDRTEVSDDSLQWWIHLTWDDKWCVSHILQQQRDGQEWRENCSLLRLSRKPKHNKYTYSHNDSVKIGRDLLYSTIFVLQVTMPAGWIMEAVLPSAWLSQGAECVLVLTTNTWTGTMSPAQVSHFKPTCTEHMR